MLKKAYNGVKPIKPKKEEYITINPNFPETQTINIIELTQSLKNNQPQTTEAPSPIQKISQQNIQF